MPHPEYLRRWAPRRIRHQALDLLKEIRKKHNIRMDLSEISRMAREDASEKELENERDFFDRDEEVDWDQTVKHAQLCAHRIGDTTAPQVRGMIKHCRTIAPFQYGSPEAKERAVAGLKAWWAIEENRIKSRERNYCQWYGEGSDERRAKFLKLLKDNRDLFSEKKREWWTAERRAERAEASRVENRSEEAERKSREKRKATKLAYIARQEAELAELDQKVVFGVPNPKNGKPTILGLTATEAKKRKSLQSTISQSKSWLRDIETEEKIAEANKSLPPEQRQVAMSARRKTTNEKILAKKKRRLNTGNAREPDEGDINDSDKENWDVMDLVSDKEEFSDSHRCQ